MARPATATWCWRACRRPPTANPWCLATPLPYTREASGIALGPCQAVFVADTAHDRVLLHRRPVRRAGPGCRRTPGAWSDAPGQFKQPRGLACGERRAAGGRQRQRARAEPGVPRLEAHVAWASWTAAGRPGGRPPAARAGDRCGQQALHRIRANGMAGRRVRRRHRRLGAVGAAAVRRLRRERPGAGGRRAAQRGVRVRRRRRLPAHSARRRRLAAGCAGDLGLARVRGRCGQRPHRRVRAGRRFGAADRQRPRLAGTGHRAGPAEAATLYIKPGLDAGVSSLRRRCRLPRRRAA